MKKNIKLKIRRANITDLLFTLKLHNENVQDKNFFSKKKNIKNYYYLNRNIGLIEKIFFNIFRNKIIKEYNEIIFHPELNLYLGKKNSFLSTLDSKMSNSNFLGSLFSRQVLIKTKK